MHFVGVFNRDGGTFRTMDMEAFTDNAVKVFASHGHVLEPRVVEGKDLIHELQRAASDPHSDAVLAGGGDGTISTAAEICFHAGMPLAVLPAGTMNLFARSLKIPMGLEQALEALASGETRQVDIATVNGKTFVHQYSVGIHTRLVRLREELVYRSRIGKILASTRAFIKAVRRPPVFWAEIRTTRGMERRRATGITVTNNVLGEGHVPYADDIDRGVLGVYILKPLAPLALARLCFDVIMGRWKGTPALSEREVREVTLVFPRKKSSALALIDGELTDLSERVELRIHPGGLHVV
ncbi:MAG: diacylglycerol kinase family lipid kinase, partial [Hyphomicrobiales bacterium]